MRRLLVVLCVAAGLLLLSQPASATVQRAPVVTTQPGTFEARVPQYDFTWGWTSGTIYFNRGETHTFAVGGWGVTMLTTVCGAFGAWIGGPPVAAIFAGTCALQGGWFIATAGVADYYGKCVKLRFPGGYPGTHTGSRCH